jgi:hypothetical protein
MAAQQPRVDVEDVEYGTKGAGMEGMQERGEGYLRHGYTEMQECVSEYPMASTLSAFGIGLGIGLLIGMTLAGESRPRPRHWYDLGSAEDYGRRILDAVTSALPDSIAKRIT